MLTLLRFKHIETFHCTTKPTKVSQQHQQQEDPIGHITVSSLLEPHALPTLPTLPLNVYLSAQYAP